MSSDDAYQRLLGLGQLKNQGTKGTASTPTASTEGDANARWTACLAFVDQGVALATVQQVVTSSMSDDEAVSMLQTLLPVKGSGGGESGSAAADTPLAADNQRMDAIEKAVGLMAESQKQTASLIAKLAATPEVDRVNNPPTGEIEGPEGAPDDSKLDPSLQQERILEQVTNILPKQASAS